MPQVRSRRELYSEATRAALLEEATRLFGTRGYAGTSLADVAVASQVTRGAVYHHFDGKQALFEAVLGAQETRAIARITAAATAADPLEAARQALDAFLDQCCDPIYGRLVWLEGPAALGWHRWRECEQKYAFGLVERFITALVDAGYLPGQVLLLDARRGRSGPRRSARGRPPPAARGVALPHPPDDHRPASWVKRSHVTYS
jgi:AcrR family transcriptional regulator